MNLRNSGVHGAAIVLEPSFGAEAFATALGIPSSKAMVRKHLADELSNLITPARFDCILYYEFVCVIESYLRLTISLIVSDAYRG